jgi:hypothetical protein
MDCGAAREQQQNGFLFINKAESILFVNHGGSLTWQHQHLLTPTITKQSAQVNVQEPCLYQYWSVIDFFPQPPADNLFFFFLKLGVN